MFSSEIFLYSSRHGWGLVPTQYRWMKRNLARLDHAKTPWLVTMSHCPMYCSPNDDRGDCHQRHSLVRDGLPYFNTLGSEKLLQDFKVDFHVGAHEHFYERTWPVFKVEVGGKGAGAYDAPVGADWLDKTEHLVVGAGGCRENTDPWFGKAGPWSAMWLDGYGFGLLNTSRTDLNFEQVDHATGEIIDRFTITKTVDAFQGQVA